MTFLDKLIICPVCFNELEKRNNKLYCHECGQIFEIKENIPILLRSELFDEENKDKELTRKREEMKVFDKTEEYEELMKRPYFCHLKEQIDRELEQPKEGKSDVLEVGSGISIFADKFSGKNLVLSDISFSLLTMNKNVKDKVVADGEYLPFREQSFDFIYSIGLIHHLSNQRRGLKELRRLIKSGGQIFISEPTKWSLNLIYYLLRRLFMVFFGKNLLRRMTGCGTSYESFIDLKQVEEIFKNDFEIKTKKIMPFRLPPFRFLEKQKWPVSLNKVLEKIPLINSLGTIVFITLTKKTYYGVR
jgi:ubiquinone/menaquinone biosynthesis C-methylase UbiE